MKLLPRAGHLDTLTLQPAFDITVNGKKCATYRADFSYYDAGGKLIVEDVKGFRTQTYRLKKKLVEALHGIEITEIAA